jgi:hypothetical protein
VDMARSRSWAKTGLMHRSKKRLYSITSSAVASSLSGILRPSALAVFPSHPETCNKNEAIS